MAKLPFPVQNTDVSLETFVKTNLRGKRKLKKLGNGAFGTVFGTKSGKTVVKIGYLTDVWGDSVDGNVSYLRFIATAMKYPTNPFFPKIKSVKLFKHKGGETYMVVEMERLNELPSEHYNLASLMSQLAWDKRRAETYGMLGLSAKVVKALKEVHTVIQTVRNRYHCSTDIHAGNVMIRGKNQLVVTDPVA